MEGDSIMFAIALKVKKDTFHYPIVVTAAATTAVAA
jgi:hypothetical protein